MNEPMNERMGNKFSHFKNVIRKEIPQTTLLMQKKLWGKK